MTDDQIGGLRIVDSEDLRKQSHTPLQRYRMRAMSCIGKQAFTTPQEAQRAIDGFARRKKSAKAKNDKGGKMGFFKCQGCGAYHLTHKK